MSEQPILAKISELDELLSTDAADNLVVVDVSEADATKRTKRARMDKLKLTSVDQISDGIVANSKLALGAVSGDKIANSGISSEKIADGAIGTAKLANRSVTDVKLGGISRTVIVPLFDNEDAVLVKSFANKLRWPVTLAGWKIIGLYATLAAVSTSGSVTVAVSNAGGVVGTLTIAQGQSGTVTNATINTSYQNVSQNGGVTFNVTSAGSGATGLSVIFVLQGQP